MMIGKGFNFRIAVIRRAGHSDPEIRRRVHLLHRRSEAIAQLLGSTASVPVFVDHDPDAETEHTGRWLP